MSHNTSNDQTYLPVQTLYKHHSTPDKLSDLKKQSSSLLEEQEIADSIIKKINKKTQQLQQQRNSFENKQFELSDLRKLLLHVSNQNIGQIYQVGEEVESLQEKLKELKAALAASYSSRMQDCAMYWRECV